MIDICEGCEGDKFCGIQDDIRHPDYKCPLPDRFKTFKDKLEAVKTHMESAPDRVPRDNWLRPTKSFLLQVLDWIIAHRKILEAEG